jgi:hypothetical protein
VSDRRGHIKLSRKLFEDDPWWNEKRPRTRIEAWLDVLYLAAFRARVHMTTDGPIPLDRGQFVASYRYLAGRWGWSVKAVRTWIETGKKWARIRAQRETHAGTVYVIVNYDLYQSGGTDQGTAGGTVEGTEGAQLGHSRGTRKKQLSSKAVKETWLTPFGHAWEARCGSPPFKRLAKALEEPCEKLGADEALLRWCRYLDATEPRYCSPERFLATHAAYAGPEVQEMADDFGRMVPHRKNGAGEWVPVASVA